MPKEILLYGNISDLSAAEFVKELNGAIDDAIVTRVNTNGGEVSCTWAMVAKFFEHPLEKTVIVDGKAFSGGAFFCCYADHVECYDFSEFLIHRAAYPDWYEKDYLTEAQKADLVSMNNKLKAAFEGKVDLAALQAIIDKKPSMNGVKVADIWSLDSRVDITLSAKEAKKIGLVDVVRQITPKKKAEIESLSTRFIEQMAEASGLNHKSKENTQTKNSSTMDLTTLKSDHPEVYDKIFAAGIAAEKDRAGAWLAFLDADATAVVKGIKDGENLSMTAMSEFSLKLVSKTALGKLENEAAKDIKTDAEGKVTKEGDQAGKDTELASFEKSVRESLGLKPLA